MNLPKEPPPGLLMSMALRYDHALGCPGFYDSEFYKESGVTHQQRLESTLVTMSQLYEEVAGYGFYQPEKEAMYAKMKTESLAGIKKDPTHFLDCVGVEGCKAPVERKI